MDTVSPIDRSAEVIDAVCRELLRLAKSEEDAAALEAASTPYWTPCPESVQSHRAAATVLRADALRLQAAAHAMPQAS